MRALAELLLPTNSTVCRAQDRRRRGVAGQAGAGAGEEEQAWNGQRAGGRGGRTAGTFQVRTELSGGAPWGNTHQTWAPTWVFLSLTSMSTSRRACSALEVQKRKRMSISPASWISADTGWGIWLIDFPEAMLSGGIWPLDFFSNLDLTKKSGVCCLFSACAAATLLASTGGSQS